MYIFSIYKSLPTKVEV